MASLAIATPALGLDPDRQFFQYMYGAPSLEMDLPTDILDIEQNHDGSLWLATSRGLARYDGLEFTLFRVSEYPEILSNNPTQLFVDSSNRLFVASARGVSMYYNDAFRVLATGTQWATDVHAFAEDDSGQIWFGSDNGLWRLSGSEVEPGPIDESAERIRSLLWQDSQLFVGGRGRVHVIRDTTVTAIDLPPEYARDTIQDMEFHQGRLWLATRASLFTLEGDSAVPLEANELDGLSFVKLLSDRDDNLWFIDRRNIGRILPDGAIEIPDVEDETFGFVPEFTEIFEDDAGLLWQTSRLFGLAHIGDTDIRRVSYSEGLNSPNVTAIAPAETGAVLVATDQGVAMIAGDEVTNVVQGDFSPGSTIRSLMLDSTGRLWVGTESELRLYDLEEDGWLQSPTGVQSELVVNAMVQDAAERIWVATTTGLFSIDNNQANAVFETSGLAIESLLVDKQGDLWLGTENGVAKIVDGKFEQLAPESIGPLPNVVSLVEAQTGEIIAATTDRGIAVFDGERWSAFGERDGLPPEQLIDVEVDADRLWLVTGSGVFRATIPTRNEFGEVSAEVSPVAATPRYRSAHSAYCCRGGNGNAAVLDDGSAFVATDDGIIIFDLDISSNTDVVPVPYVKGAIAGEVEFKADHGAEQATEVDSRQLRIDYSAVQLGRGEQVRFRHRLLGLSNAWVDAGKSRTVQYQNLPPGDYSFELQASFRPGVWSPTAAGLDFERLPGFFETRTFQALLWILAVGLGLLLIWRRLATIRLRHRRLEAEIKERTTALRELNAELKSANVILQQSSQTDPLTGLINRRFFDSTDGSSTIPDKISDRGVLIAIDIDHFKHVNDSYGHAAGDEVLCQFASVLRSCTRQSDLVIRWGGEEFAIICRCPNDDAPAMLDRIGAAVRDHSFTLSSGKRIQISCSIGGIRYPLWADAPLNDRLPLLMRLADAALYVVKMSGRDGWALLEGGQRPEAIFDAPEFDPNLNELVGDEHIIWSSSRPAISPSLYDTVTRLRAIRTRGR